MKIYKRIIIDLSGNILEENSFEYSGPITLCKTKAPKMPGPSPEEKELTKKSIKLLDEEIIKLRRENDLLDKLWPSLEEYFTGEIEYSTLQTEAGMLLLPLQTDLATKGIEFEGLLIDTLTGEIERNVALEPLLLEAMGYELDAEGNYVAIEGEQDPLLAKLEERYTGAIEGKDGISPHLESQLEKEKTKLGEDLSRRLGPNWQSTTPGIQALSEFDTRANLLREEARQSTIASAGSQYFMARGLMGGEQQQKVSNLLSLTGRTPGAPTGVSGAGGAGGGGIPSGLMGGTDFSSVSGGISNLRDYYKGQRYDKWAASQGQGAGRTSAMMGGALGGAQIGGTVGGPWGAAIGGGTGLLFGYLLS